MWCSGGAHGVRCPAGKFKTGCRERLFPRRKMCMERKFAGRRWKCKIHLELLHSKCFSHSLTLFFDFDCEWYSLVGFEIIFLFVICAINKTNTGQLLFYIESPELYFGVEMFLQFSDSFVLFILVHLYICCLVQIGPWPLRWSICAERLILHSS